MLAPEAYAALFSWEPVNSRIITTKFTTKKKDIRLNIIQCCAPTNDAEEEKDDFYQQLQAVLDRRGTKDITINTRDTWTGKSNGKRRSEMKICGSERDRNQWPSRYCRGRGAVLDTPSGNQHPAPHAKP